MNAEAILRTRYSTELVDALLKAYREVESNYVTKKWKTSELDAGHFVEMVRRVLELELTGRYTPVSQPLPKLNEPAMKQYENVNPKADDSYRMLIPRALFAVYGIRNKRGVGHVAGVSANEMDATFILYSVKWVLAEIVRLASGASVADTQRAIDEIVERQLSILWKHGDITRVLDTSVKTPGQILVLLYDKSPQTDAELLSATEYSNASKFRGILRDLHKRRLINYQDGECAISPSGLAAAER